MAMMVVIFLAIVPIFYVVRKGWDSKEANAEVLQSGRVLIDHISRTLSQAAEITEVSAPVTNAGHITFIANDGNSMEYTTGAGYVTYGLAGTTQYLAGPVTQIHYACYDGNDFSKHVDANNADAVKTIRVVQIRAIVTHPTKTGHEKEFETTVYLRTKYSDVSRQVGVYQTTTKSLGSNRMTPAIAQINSTHYIYVYRASGDKGYACVLTVNTTDWSVTEGTALEFEATSCYTPALVQVDPNHYLCTFRNSSTNRGWAVVLVVNPATWTITKPQNAFQYTTNLNPNDRYGYTPALVKIDGTHCLCAYSGDASDGYAIVLTINADWTVTKGAYFEYDTSDGWGPDLAKVDGTHYLCAYGGSGSDGYAVILAVNTGTWAVSKPAADPAALEYDTSNGLNPALIQVNATHYLCAYEGNSNDGFAVVLTVNTGTWKITKAAAALNYEIEYDTDSGWTPTLSKVDSRKYFCAWESYHDDGAIGIFDVNTTNWTISLWEDALHYTDTCATPALATQVDPNHFLCVYNGSGSDCCADIMERYIGGATGGSGTPEP
jgi:hypothetical protein